MNFTNIYIIIYMYIMTILETYLFMYDKYCYISLNVTFNETCKN